MKTNRLVALMVLGSVLIGAGLMGAVENSKPADNGLVWGTSFKEAISLAKAQNKVLLLDFTGSDWCPWCVRMDRDTYDTADFATFVKDKVVLVKVDFPQSTPQAEELKKQNATLQEHFHVDGFPNAIFVKSDGTELGRIEGYLPKGEWLKTAAGIVAKAK